MLKKTKIILIGINHKEKVLSLGIVKNIRFISNKKNKKKEIAGKTVRIYLKNYFNRDKSKGREVRY